MVIVRMQDMKVGAFSILTIEVESEKRVQRVKSMKTKPNKPPTCDTLMRLNHSLSPL